MPTSEVPSRACILSPFLYVTSQTSCLLLRGLPRDPREKTPPPSYLTPFLLTLLPFLIAITHFNMLNMHLVSSASFHQNGQPQRPGLRLFMPSPQEACNKHLLREGIHKAVLSVPAILLLGYSTVKGCINSYW